MKRSLSLFVIALVSICLFSSFTKKDKTPKAPKSTGVYIFGFSASFTDSTVYFTTIQPIDGVSLTKKTKFLPNCPDYSYQLKDYLESKRGEKDRICATFAKDKKSDIEKTYLQLKRQCAAQKNLKVVYLDDNDFKYTKFEEEIEEEETPTEEAPADSTEVK